MAVRALIIAVQDYAEAKGLARKLPGTLQAGLDFRDWLLAKLKADGTDAGAQVIFCSDPPQRDGRRARRADVIGALLDLRTAGRGATDELFVFFSGHGFAFVDRPGSRADVVITSDFVDGDRSGDCCLNLNEMVEWL